MHSSIYLRNNSIQQCVHCACLATYSLSLLMGVHCTFELTYLLVLLMGVFICIYRMKERGKLGGERAVLL